MALGILKPICETFNVTQGCDAEKIFQIVDQSDVAINITSFTATFVLKNKKGGTTELSISTADSSPNSRVEIPVGTDGKIHVIITDTDTTGMTEFTEGVYLLKATDASAIVNPVAEGDFLVTEDI